jgi:hypothetical protein
MGLRDCATFTSSRCNAGPPLPPLSARLLALPPPRAAGTLGLRLLICPSSTFYPAEEAEAQLAKVLEQVNALLAPAALVASYSSVNRLPADAICDATFAPSDPSPLALLLQQGRGLAEDPASISVVFAGCLRAMPLVGPRADPDGYTPRIPGGYGNADAVFVRGSLCDTAGPVRIAWSGSALGRVLAHELGHYLGLYHTVEADGTVDQLDDTGAGADNLMYFEPSVASATGLSATQGQIARRHPLVHAAACD